MSKERDPYGTRPDKATYRPVKIEPVKPTTTTPMPQHPREFRYVKSIEESKKKHLMDEYGRSLDRTILEKVEERRSKPPGSELAKRLSRRGQGR